MSVVASLDHALVDIGTPAKLNFTGSISIMAWVRVGATDGFRNIIGHGITTSLTEVFLRVYRGVYEVGSWDITRQDHLASYPIPSSDPGNWVHLCGTHDGTTWRLYRNGILVGQTADPVGALAVPEPWSIGGRPVGADPRFFEGLIAHVSVWNVALDAAAIAVRVQYPALSGSEPGLVAYWPMTEGTGQVIADKAANPANGTLRSWCDTDPIPGWALESSGTRLYTTAANAVLPLNDKVWMVRGDAIPAVLSSPDLRIWSEELRTPPWATEPWRATVLHNGAIYVLQGNTLTDVWRSPDGRSWTQMTAAAPWAPRTAAALASFLGRLWVMGGTLSGPNPRDVNDVWSSADGASWQQEATPSWSRRSLAAACVFNNRLWIIAGHAGGAATDVWSTGDGTNWQSEQPQAFPMRFGASAVVLGGRMWVLGGVGAGGAALSDVYATTDGRTWTQVAPSSPWGGREQQGASVIGGRIVMNGGIWRSSAGRLDDIWSYTPAKTAAVEVAGVV